MQIERSLPQEDGSLIMFGSGEATVTYHSGAGLRVTSGSPFTAKLDVNLMSKDGRTAEINIDNAADEPDHEISMEPGGFKFSVQMDTPPTVTVNLQDGASVPYSETHGSGKHQAGTTGTVTLHYCPSSTH